MHVVATSSLRHTVNHRTLVDAVLHHAPRRVLDAAEHAADARAQTVADDRRQRRAERLEHHLRHLRVAPTARQRLLNTHTASQSAARELVTRQHSLDYTLTSSYLKVYRGTPSKIKQNNHEKRTMRQLW